MRLRWLGLSALALAAMAPGRARADADPVQVAVLGMETMDAPSALADQITDELRQRISASHDMKLVSGPTKDLVEIKLVFSCADEAPSCMAQAAKSLGADKLIFGSIKRTGGDFAVWIKQLDARKEAVESWVTDTLKKQADAAVIKVAASRWFAKLTGHAASAGAGAVQVTANLPGATVTLDGVPAGVTGDQPLTIPEVAAGKHEVSIEKAGHASARQQLVVVGGQTASVNLTLQTTAAPAGGGAGSPNGSGASIPAGGGAPARDSQPASGDGRGGYRTGFWVTLAAGLVSAGAAVKFGMDVAQINKDLDPHRRLTCPGGSGVCNAKGMRFPDDQVRPSEEEQIFINRKTDEGSRAETLQWLFVGVGSAFAIASGYLLYRGYLDSDAPAGSRQEAHRGLRIFPTAGASSGGVVAEFEF